MTVSMLYRNCQVTPPWLWCFRWEWTVPHGWGTGLLLGVAEDGIAPHPQFSSENRGVFVFFCSMGGISTNCHTVKLGIWKGLCRPGRPVVFPPPSLLSLCSCSEGFFLFSLVPVVSDSVFLALVVTSLDEMPQHFAASFSLLPQPLPSLGWRLNDVFSHSCAS